jgi:hypothetical protein
MSLSQSTTFPKRLDGDDSMVSEEPVASLKNCRSASGLDLDSGTPAELPILFSTVLLPTMLNTLSSSMFCTCSLTVEVPTEYTADLLRIVPQTLQFLSCAVATPCTADCIGCLPMLLQMLGCKFRPYESLKVNSLLLHVCNLGASHTSTPKCLQTQGIGIKPAQMTAPMVVTVQLLAYNAFRRYLCQSKYC